MQLSAGISAQNSIQRGLSELFDAAHIPVIHVSCLLNEQAARGCRELEPCCALGCGTFGPLSSDCPSVCPLSGLGMFALNQERNKDVLPSSSLFFCPPQREHRLGYQEEDGCDLQILRVHPCHPTPGNTYSFSAPHRPKPSLSLEGGCKSFRKIMPVKVNCGQNKMQFPLKLPPCLKLYSLFSYFCCRKRDCTKLSRGYTVYAGFYMAVVQVLW